MRKRKAAARQAEAPPIAKSKALTILKASGPCGVVQFAAALVAAGFVCPGPRKAFNVLSRLHAQGLASRDAQRGEVEYAIKGGKESPPRAIRRAQTMVFWSITPKGEGRLRWLLQRGK